MRYPERIFFVPEEILSVRATGEVICDHWWIAHPERGLAFYAYADSPSPYPQCNRELHVAEVVHKRLYPDLVLRHVPMVFMVNAMSAMREHQRDMRQVRRQKQNLR